jgi:hypothetical protein
MTDKAKKIKRNLKEHDFYSKESNKNVIKAKF